MLYEIPHVKQIPGEPQRRWFVDDEFDLTLWLDAQQQVLGFQLAYDKNQDQHALTWHLAQGFSHDRIDDGENRPGRYKGTPILLPNGLLHSHRLLERFRAASQGLEPALVAFICAKIQSYVLPSP